jgi:transposase
MKRYELTPQQWERVKDLLPPESSGKRGRPRKDNKTMLNGMLWIVRSGAQWRCLPECYGPWQSVYSRYRLWLELGIFETIFKALGADADMENLSIDSTSVRVHESANGLKKGL